MSGRPRRVADVLVVCGLAESGAATVVEMLRAGGAELAPATAEDVAELPARSAFLGQAFGRVLKVRDPHLHQMPPAIPARFVVVTRNHDDQAAAMASAGRILGLFGDDAASLERLASSLDADETSVLEALRGRAILRLSFDELVRRPAAQLGRVVRFFGFESFSMRPATAALRRAQARP